MNNEKFQQAAHHLIANGTALVEQSQLRDSAMSDREYVRQEIEAMAEKLEEQAKTRLTEKRSMNHKHLQAT